MPIENEGELVTRLLVVLEKIPRSRFDCMLYLLFRCAAKVCKTRNEMGRWLGMDMLRTHYFCDKWDIKIGG